MLHNLLNSYATNYTREVCLSELQQALLLMTRTDLAGHVFYTVCAVIKELSVIMFSSEGCHLHITVLDLHLDLHMIALGETCHNDFACHDLYRMCIYW